MYKQRIKTQFMERKTEFVVWKGGRGRRWGITEV
jgi:hypothetical protein